MSQSINVSIFRGDLMAKTTRRTHLKGIKVRGESWDVEVFLALCTQQADDC